MIAIAAVTIIVMTDDNNTNHNDDRTKNSTGLIPTWLLY